MSVLSLDGMGGNGTRSQGVGLKVEGQGDDSTTNREQYSTRT